MYIKLKTGLTGVGKTMDVSLETVKANLEPKWVHFGRKKNLETSEKVMEILNSQKFKASTDSNFSCGS